MCQRAVIKGARIWLGLCSLTLPIKTREHGVALAGSYSKPVKGSKIHSLRELRKVLNGRKIRILYAFDPLRRTIILTGGDKTNDKQWYEKT